MSPDELLLQATRAWNIAVRERPQDEELWLEFAAYQHSAAQQQQQRGRWAQPCCQLHHMHQQHQYLHGKSSNLSAFLCCPVHKSVAEQHLVLLLSNGVSMCACIAGLPAQGC